MSRPQENVRNRYKEAAAAYMDAHGEWNVDGFIEEARNPDHPCHDYYDWDMEVAAYKHYRHITRELFASVKTQVPAPTQANNGKPVKLVSMPKAVSPIENRRDGGGYILADSPRGRKALREEGEKALVAHIKRYEAVYSPEIVTLLMRANRKLKAFIEAEDSERSNE